MLCIQNNIHGDLPGILDGMLDFADPLPPYFFVNLGSPPAPTVVEAKTVEVHLSKAAKDPVEDVIPEE